LEWEKIKICEELYLIFTSCEDDYEDDRIDAYVVCKEEEKWKIAVNFAPEMIMHIDFIDSFL